MKKKDISKLKLSGGLLLIWLFVTQVGHLITRYSHEPIIQYSEERGIDSGALFYSESPKGMEANYLMMKSDCSID